MQNYPTQTIQLNQHWYEMAQDFPVFYPDDQPESERYAYRVVDVELASGRRLEGLLLLGGDALLIPQSEDAFVAEDIAALQPTPKDQHPDFTITEPEQLWGAQGSASTIEMYNSRRLQMFGPDEEENPREWPLERAWREARQDHDRVLVFEEIGAAYWGVRSIELVAGGVKVSWQDPSSQTHEEIVQPWTDRFWAEILDYHPKIHPDFRFRDLLELLDLPPEVDEKLYLRVMPGTGYTFQPWVQALRHEPDQPPSANLDYIEVSPWATRMDSRGLQEALHLDFDVQAMGKPLSQQAARQQSQSHGANYRAGDRINWSLMGVDIMKLLDLPIRYNPEITIPVSHEETMAYMRGDLRRWRRGGREGPEPPHPYEWQGECVITLRELIRSLLWEIPAPELGSTP